MASPSPAPVSYTHLDVYKRQYLNSLTEKQDEYKHNIGLAEETKGTGDCRRYSHLQQREDTGGSH